jgi:hypothetical protein
MHALLAPADAQRRLTQQAAAAQQQHRGQALAAARAAHPVPPVDPAAVQATHQLEREPGSVPPGAVAEGVALVSEATALGVTHTSVGRSKVDWGALLQQVYGRYTYIAQLPLSMFGRAFAASAYGMAKILYAAEYAGLPPEPHLTQLVKATAALVDRGLAPGAPGRHFAGVAADMLGGNPKEGGFGCLHLVEHVRARHAMWAVRLMLGSSAVPWVHVARHIMSGGLRPDVAAQQHGAIAMCADLCKPTGTPLPPTLNNPGSGVQCTAWLGGVPRGAAPWGVVQ